MDWGDIGIGKLVRTLLEWSGGEMMMMAGTWDKDDGIGDEEMWMLLRSGGKNLLTDWM